MEPGGDALKPTDSKTSKTSKKTAVEQVVKTKSKTDQNEPSEPVAQRKNKNNWKRTCKNMCRFVWNPAEKKACGRGCRRWCLLTIFYVVFYFTLGCIFAGLLGAVLTLLNKDAPHMQHVDQESFLGKSLIQRYPAVIIIPRPNRAKNKDTPLIWIPDDKGEQKFWGQGVVHATNAYKKNNKSKSSFQPRVDERCDPTKDAAGYLKKQPTFIIRLTKIQNWKAKPFSKPDAAKAYISDQIKNEAILKQFKDLDEKEHFISATPGKIPMLCAGATPDDDQLLGEVYYCNAAGMESKLFRGEKNFSPPFVMIKLLNPTRGIPISISCFPILDKLQINPQRSWSAETFEVLIE